jgi:hypothetical protein
VLGEADIKALLQDLEQQVLEEIQAELAEWERLHQEEAQAVVSMAEQHLQFVGGAGDGGVLCPVCKAAHLALRHGLLCCPSEGWRLNLAAEGLSLEAVRARLAAAYEVRRTRGAACCCRAV